MEIVNYPSPEITLQGTGGILTTKVGNTWYVDGSNIEGGATASGAGVLLSGHSAFTGHTGTPLTHNLGTLDHTIFITPAS
jgi:hypothetical protein